MRHRNIHETAPSASSRHPVQTKGVSDSAVGIEKESESLQVAYTMGAMTIAAAMSESTGEVAATDKYEENTLSFNFAF